MKLNWLPRAKIALRLVTVLSALAWAMLLGGSGPPAGAQDPLSDDDSLSSITVDGALLDGFAPTTFTYFHRVSAQTTRVTLAVTTSHANADLRISVGDADLNTSGHQVNVPVGRNRIEITVIPENGSERDYQLFLNRSGSTAFAYQAERDFNNAEIRSQLHIPHGIWSDGETIWVADSFDDKLYAFRMSDGARQELRDFDTLRAAGNRDPRGIWSDGETMWVADGRDDKLYAYRMADGARDEDRDFDTLGSAGNRDPRGIWSDGETMWVADSGTDKIYAYQFRNRERDTDREINALSADGNGDPRGIWSDGVTLWVADEADAKLYAYGLADGERTAGRDSPDLFANSYNRRPRGVWSDGELIWVVDETYHTVPAYHLNQPGKPGLAGITINGTAVSGVSATVESYQFADTVPLSAHVTIAVSTVESGAVASFGQPDILDGTAGHQLALDEGANSVQIVLSGAGQPSFNTYQLTINAGDAPGDSSSQAWLQVDEPGDGLTQQFRGAIGSASDRDWINVSLDALEDGFIYGFVLKGRNFGETDRSLHPPYLGGLRSMSVLQDGTQALGAHFYSPIDGWARVLFKPESAGVVQAVVSGLGEEQLGSYDLRVLKLIDEHFPNGIGTQSSISFPQAPADADSYPSASATGSLRYAFDEDWFRVSDLAPGARYVIEGRSGYNYVPIGIYDEDGEPVEVSTEARGRRTIFEPPSEQDYYIRVYSSNRWFRAGYTVYIHPPLSLGEHSALGGPFQVQTADIFDHDGTERATRADDWTYEWFRFDEHGARRRIRGADGPGYQPTPDMLGERLFVRVCYRDDRNRFASECRDSELATARTLAYDSRIAPSDLDAGERFRLLVLSSDKRGAQQTESAAYDQWLRSQLRKDDIEPPVSRLAAQFQALVSTAEASAIDHTGTSFSGTELGPPIYWLGTASRLADSYQDFWDGSWSHREVGITDIDRIADDDIDEADPTENSVIFGPTDYVWTGTNSDGSGASGAALGASNAAAALPHSGEGHEVRSALRATTEQHYLYGLSKLFRIAVPEVPYLLRAGGITVSSTPTASSDSYGLGERIEFRLTFSEAVAVTGDPQFGFILQSKDHPRRADYVGGSGTTQLSFRYTVQAADRAQSGIGWQPSHDSAQPFLLDEDDRITDASGAVDARLLSFFNKLSDHKVNGNVLPYDSVLAPLDLAAGAQFRFLVLSSDKRSAQETEFAAYDEWIRSQLRKDDIKPDLRLLAPAFQALVSTAGRPAAAHTDTGTASGASAPIYWAGTPLKVADSYQDFWDGSWSHREVGITGIVIADADDDTDPNVEFGETDYVWTGTRSDGSLAPGAVLGAANAAAARPHSGAGHEVRSTLRPTTEQHYLYGLSQVLQIAQPAVPYLLRVGGISVTSTPVSTSDTYGEGEQIEFTLTFSQAVSVTGDPQFRFSMAASADLRQADYVSGSGTTKLIFRYTVQAGDHSNGIAWQEHTHANHPFLLDDDDRISDSSGTDDALFFTPDSSLRNHKVDAPLPMTDEQRQANSPAAGSITLNGEAQVGETLSATSAISDQDGMVDAVFAYQWFADDAAIQGATARRYTLTSEERGKRISLTISFTDELGNAESLTSEPTAAVVAESNQPATGQPTIAGTVVDNALLSVDTSQIEDANGITTASFSYQWLAGETDAVQPISGATHSTIRLTSEQARQEIRVRVSFTDDAGHTETLTSPALAPPRPTDLTAVLQDGAIRLSWTAPVDFAFHYDYRILRTRLGVSDSLVTVDTQSSETSYTDTDVEAGASYRYQVQAGNWWGRHSVASTAVEVGIPERPAPTAPPAAPTNLTAQVNADGGITLNWDAPNDDSITGYLILRRRPREGERNLLTHVADTGSADTTYIDTDAPAGTLYVYRIKAINAAGISQRSNYVNVDHLP